MSVNVDRAVRPSPPTSGNSFNLATVSTTQAVELPKSWSKAFLTLTVSGGTNVQVRLAVEDAGASHTGTINLTSVATLSTSVPTEDADTGKRLVNDREYHFDLTLLPFTNTETQRVIVYHNSDDTNGFITFDKSSGKASGL